MEFANEQSSMFLGCLTIVERIIGNICRIDIGIINRIFKVSEKLSSGIYSCSLHYQIIYHLDPIHPIVFYQPGELDLARLIKHNISHTEKLLSLCLNYKRLLIKLQKAISNSIKVIVTRMISRISSM